MAPGYNMLNSEMSMLYYVTLKNVGYQAKDGSYPTEYGLINTLDFDNLLPDYYWSGTELPLFGPCFFYFAEGLSSDAVGDSFRAIAVMSGDAAPVPLPGAVWLLGTGLLGLIRVRRKQ